MDPVLELKYKENFYTSVSELTSPVVGIAAVVPHAKPNVASLQARAYVRPLHMLVHKKKKVCTHFGVCPCEILLLMTGLDGLRVVIELKLRLAYWHIDVSDYTKSSEYPKSIATK